VERRKPEYYVVTKTYWRGDRFTPAEGPFSTRAEATAIANGIDSRNHHDICSAVIASVRTYSELKRMGYTNYSIWWNCLPPDEREYLQENCPSYYEGE
jgi:hypothetical protein